MIYTGKSAAAVLNRILFKNQRIRAKGIFRENKYWIAFDNYAGDCFEEEFSKEKYAIAWVNNCFEFSDIQDTKIFKLLPKLYFVYNIYNRGFLWVSKKMKLC